VWHSFSKQAVRSISAEENDIKPPLLTTLALWAIRLYQRVISPRKGFRCAYRAYTGHASCSALGYRAIRRFGVPGGIAVLNSRLHKCGVAHRRYRPSPQAMLAGQAGFIDCDCGDAPCECDLPCDCGSEKKSKKKKKPDRDVKLPPRRSA
jgi:putative component of membrane protein insertase Oxa1/YidC/SpoIIIJ protein YidD